MAIESITGRVSNLTPIKPAKKAEVDDQRQVSASGIKQEGVVAETTVIQGFRKAVELSSPSTVDVGRVNSIKQALAEGSYQIDAAKIAKKMLDFEKIMPPDDSA